MHLRTEQTSFAHRLLLPVFAFGYRHSLCQLFGFFDLDTFFLCGRDSVVSGLLETLDLNNNVFVEVLITGNSHHLS